MDKLTPVTRYICEYCKKDFRTSNRHDCKRDPEKKNCYTCKNNTGWELVKEETNYGEYGNAYNYIWTVTCDKGFDDITAPDLAREGYFLNCNEWEKKENENED